MKNHHREQGSEDRLHRQNDCRLCLIHILLACCLKKIADRCADYLRQDAEQTVLPCEGSPRVLLCAFPIIVAGDVTGAVGLLTEDRSAKPDASQQKAVAVAAAFLAKQMEE